MQLSNHRYYPWLIVFMSALFLFYNYIIQVSPSVMTKELAQQFHINATGLGNLAAIFFYSYLFVQLLLGPLYDKYSPRLLSTGAIFLMTIGTYGFSQTHTLEGAYLFRLLMGAGAGFATVSYLKLTALWFSKEQYSFVAGLLATAASTGAILGQAPLAYSVTHLGWQQTLFYVFILGLIVTSLFGLFVKAKPNKNQPITAPSEKLSMKLFLALLKQKKVLLLALYSGLAWAPLAVLGGLWGNPFLQTAYHLSNTQAASLISFAFLGFAFGGPLSGLLIKIHSNKFIWMHLGLIISIIALCNILFNPYNNLTLIGFFLFLFGLGTGAFMLGFSLGRDWVAPAVTASIIALINTGDAILGAITEPLVGKLLDVIGGAQTVSHLEAFNYHTYQIAMSMLPIYLIMAMFVLFIINRLDCKEYRRP